MRIKLLLLCILYSFFCFSQNTSNETESNKEKNKHTFFRLNISFPIGVNPRIGQTDPYTGEKEYWFQPIGLVGRVSYGINIANWLDISANIGMDWKWNVGFVTLPKFISLRIKPKIGSNYSNKVFIEPGLGQTTVIGRNNLDGYFKNLKLGVMDQEGTGFYIEVCQYGLIKGSNESLGSFSVGITKAF